MEWLRAHAVSLTVADKPPRYARSIGDALPERKGKTEATGACLESGTRESVSRRFLCHLPFCALSGGAVSTTRSLLPAWSTSMTELSPPVALFSGYAFLGRIGAGAYGTVFLARSPSGPPCAVKFVLAARARRRALPLPDVLALALSPLQPDGLPLLLVPGAVDGIGARLLRQTAHLRQVDATGDACRANRRPALAASPIAGLQPLIRVLVRPVSHAFSLLSVLSVVDVSSGRATACGRSARRPQMRRTG